MRKPTTEWTNTDLHMPTGCKVSLVQKLFDKTNATNTKTCNLSLAFVDTVYATKNCGLKYAQSSPESCKLKTQSLEVLTQSLTLFATSGSSMHKQPAKSNLYGWRGYGILEAHRAT